MPSQLQKRKQICSLIIFRRTLVTVIVLALNREHIKSFTTYRSTQIIFIWFFIIKLLLGVPSLYRSAWCSLFWIVSVYLELFSTDLCQFVWIFNIQIGSENLICEGLCYFNNIIDWNCIALNTMVGCMLIFDNIRVYLFTL